MTTQWKVRLEMWQLRKAEELTKAYDEAWLLIHRLDESTRELRDKRDREEDLSNAEKVELYRWQYARRDLQQVARLMEEMREELLKL